MHKSGRKHTFRLEPIENRQAENEQSYQELITIPPPSSEREGSFL